MLPLLLILLLVLLNQTAESVASVAGCLLVAMQARVAGTHHLALCYCLFLPLLGSWVGSVVDTDEFDAWWKQAQHQQRAPPPPLSQVVAVAAAAVAVVRDWVAEVPMRQVALHNAASNGQLPPPP